MHFFLHSVYLWYYTKINVLLRHPVFNVYSLLQVVQSIFMRCQKSQTENHFISSKRLHVAVGRVLSGIGTAVQQVGCTQEMGQQCSGQGAFRDWDSSAVGRVLSGIGTAVQWVGCFQELGQQCSGQGAFRNWDSSAVGRLLSGIGTAIQWVG